MLTAEETSLNALLQIIATPAAAKKRLDELIEQTKKLEAAKAELLGAQSIAEIRAELATREAMLNMRGVDVDAIEAKGARIAAALAVLA